MTNDQSISYLKQDLSFVDPYPRSRGIAGAAFGAGSGLNVSASDI